MNPSSSPSTTDLLADLLAEFAGPKAKKPAAEKKTKATTPPPVSEYSEINRISRLLDSRSPWVATSVIAHIVEQECACCAGRTKHLGNTLVRFHHKITTARWDCLMPEAPKHALLPHELFYHFRTVPQCPSCLELGQGISAALSPLPRTRAGQLPLFAQ